MLFFSTAHPLYPPSLRPSPPLRDPMSKDSQRTLKGPGSRIVRDQVSR